MNGEIVMRLKRCDDAAKVSAVELQRMDRARTVLWGVTAPAGSSSDTFTIGVTPSGFEETESLKESPPAGTHYLAIVSLLGKRDKPSTEFDPRDLDSTSWHISAGKAISEAEFDKLKPC